MEAVLQGRHARHTDHGRISDETVNCRDGEARIEKEEAGQDETRRDDRSVDEFVIHR